MRFELHHQVGDGTTMQPRPQQADREHDRDGDVDDPADDVDRRHQLVEPDQLQHADGDERRRPDPGEHDHGSKRATGGSGRPAPARDRHGDRGDEHHHDEDRRGECDRVRGALRALDPEKVRRAGRAVRRRPGRDGA